MKETQPKDPKEAPKSEEEAEETPLPAVDLSAVPTDVVKKAQKAVKMGFTLHYSLLKEGEERDVQAGDYLRLSFPRLFSKLKVEDSVLYSGASPAQQEETEGEKSIEETEDVPTEVLLLDAVRWSIDEETDPITGKKWNDEKTDALPEKKETDQEPEETILTGLFLTDVKEEQVSGSVELSFELTKEELEQKERETVELLLQGEKEDKKEEKDMTTPSWRQP